MRRLALVLPAGLAVAPAAGAQAPEARLPAFGLGVSAGLFGSDGRGAAGTVVGLGLGGAASVLARRDGWPGLLRAEVAHFRFAAFGEDCPTVPGASCGGGGPIALAGGTAGVLSALSGGTRGFVSAAVGAFLNRSGGATSLDGALAGGLGVGSLEPGRAGALEVRVLWLRGRYGQSFVFPLSLTLYR